MQCTPVLMMGGVGNRLFQLARALDLKRAGGSPVLVELEAVFGLDLLTRRLMGWSVHPIWIDLKSIAANLGVNYRSPLPMELLALQLELLRIRALGQKRRLNLTLSRDTRRAHVGYFQNEGCVSVVAIHDIACELDRTLDRPKSSPERVVHIRGGDFALPDRIDPEDISSFMKDCNGEAVCVTNDATYVKQICPQIAVHPSKSALDDFTTLARANYIMPSNSTFCFWACAVAMLFGDAKVTMGKRDPYWQLLLPERSV